MLNKSIWNVKLQNRQQFDKLTVLSFMEWTVFYIIILIKIFLSDSLTINVIGFPETRHDALMLKTHRHPLSF